MLPVPSLQWMGLLLTCQRLLTESKRFFRRHDQLHSLLLHIHTKCMMHLQCPPPTLTLTPTLASSPRPRRISSAHHQKFQSPSHRNAPPQPHPSTHTSPMICRTCLRASRAPTRRFLSTSPALNATPISSASTPTPRQGSPTSSHTPPAATSSSAAQPFSAPLTPTPTPAIERNAAKAADKKPTPLVKSSVPAGTPLKGLNFEKNKQDPVALADDAYPAWLWTILQRQEDKGDVGAMGDLFCTHPPSPKKTQKNHLLTPRQPNPRNSAAWPPSACARNKP